MKEEDFLFIKDNGLKAWINSCDIIKLHFFFKSFLTRDSVFFQMLSNETKISSPEQEVTERIVELPYLTLEKCKNVITELFLSSFKDSDTPDRVNSNIQKNTYHLLLRTKMVVDESKVISFLGITKGTDLLKPKDTRLLVACLAILSQKSALNYFSKNLGQLKEVKFFLLFLNILKRYDPWRCISEFVKYGFKSEDVNNPHILKSLKKRLKVALEIVIHDYNERLNLHEYIENCFTDWKVNLLNELLGEVDTEYVQGETPSIFEASPISLRERNLDSKEFIAVKILFESYIDGNVELKKLEQDNYSLWKNLVQCTSDFIKRKKHLSHDKKTKCGNLLTSLTNSKGEKLNVYLYRMEEASFDPAINSFCYVNEHKVKVCEKLDVGREFYHEKRNHQPSTNDFFEVIGAQRANQTEYI